jgi:predicted ATPase
MHVSYLLVEGVRGIYAETFSFQPGFNVIAGINGAGKSTVLQAINVVLNSCLQKKRKQRKKSDHFTSDDVRAGDNPDEELHIDLKLQTQWRGPIHISYHLPVLGKLTETILPPYEPPPKREPIVLFFGPNESLTPRLAHAGKPVTLNDATGAIESWLYHRPRFFGEIDKQYATIIGAVQEFFDDVQQITWYLEPARCRAIGNPMKLDGFDLVRKIQKELSSVIMRYLKSEKRQLPPHIADHLVMTADGTLRGLQYKEKLPSFSDLLKRYKGSSYDETILEHLEVVIYLKPKIQFKKRGAYLELRQLADGEQRLFSFIFDIARNLANANPISGNPTKEGEGVVLIDEIDLHLHPRWQRKVVGKLESLFPRCQFITTTHSPFIIQSLKPHHLATLPRMMKDVEYSDKSIEDIAEYLMDVKTPQKSERYRNMMAVAERYFRLLRSSHPESAGQAADLKHKLDELSMPFSDDPAFMALLHVERETFLGGKR